MFWLDIAIAARRDAERAFFESDEGAEDDIARVQLDGLSDFELAHLGMLLADGYTPRLVLDGETPDEIVTEMDPRLVAALAELADDELDAVATRWQTAAGAMQALGPALSTLHDFARRARTAGLPLLYAQGSLAADDDFDD